MNFELVISTERIVAVMLGLFAVCWGYDWLTAKVVAFNAGYTPFLVVGGVVIVLTFAGLLIGWGDALLTGLCFVAAGIPMIVGSIRRNLAEKRIERDAALVASARQEVNRDR